MLDSIQEHQNKIVNNVDTNLIVTASAGTGKTYTMIERAFHLIEMGVPIRRITMLTFTEKAAAEMKDRLRVRLVEALRATKDSAQRDFLVEQLDSIAYASICTIDSFCYALVREYFEQIPLSPTVRILDDSTKDYLKQRAFRRMVEDKSGDADFDAMRLMVGLRSDDNLRQLVLHLYDNMVIQPAREGWLEATYQAQCEADLDGTAAVRYLVGYVTHFMRMGCDGCRQLFALVGEDEVAKKALSTILSKFQGFEACLSYGDLCKALEDCLAVKDKVFLNKTPYGAQISYYYDILTEVRDELKKNLICGTELEVKTRHLGSKPFLRQLFDLVLSFQSLYDAEKKEVGGVDFDDLEKYAYRLLQDEGLAAEIRARHDYMFVDEFQDVNYLQSALIDRLAPLDRLFVVGDSKQCIYRFRLAEPQIFLDRVQTWGSQGKCMDLLANFRSDNGILRFVNRLFTPLMSKEFGGVDYASTDAFRLRPDAPDSGDSVVKVCLLEDSSPKGEAPTGVYSVMKTAPKAEPDSVEGRQIAHYIRSLMGQSVTIKGKSHTLSYSDFALLFTSRPSAAKVVRTLIDEGIPLNLNSFSSDNGVHEIQQVLQYAYLLNNGQDDYPLISVMRAFGGFDENDLAAIRLTSDANVPFWQVADLCAAGEGQLAARVRAFLSQVQRYRLMASFTPIHTLLSEVMSVCGYWDRVYIQKDGVAIVAALNNFLAKVATSSFATSLVDFCAYYRSHEPTECKGIAQTAGDRVVVGTVHESKGLQYPVVIVAACGAPSDNRSPDVCCDRDLGVGTPYYDVAAHWRVPTLTDRVIRLKKKMQSREDKLRLLYVAATRAQCHLLFTGVVNKSTGTQPLPAFASTFADWLVLAKRLDPTLAAYWVDEIPDATCVGTEKETQAYTVGDYQSVLDYRYPYDDVVSLGKKYTVTALNAPEDEEALPTSFVRQEGRNVLGTAYHTVFQYVDYATQDRQSLSDQIHSLVEEGLLAKEQAEQLDQEAIWRCLQLPVLREATQGNTMREQRFLMSVDAATLGLGVAEPVLVQGVIDLIIVQGNEATLVDFKYSRRSPASLRKAYKVQLDLYRMAICKSLGVEVKRSYLVEIGRALAIKMD